MKTVDITLLVLAGALAGALVMKVTQHPARVAMRPAAPNLVASSPQASTNQALPVDPRTSPIAQVQMERAGEVQREPAVSIPAPPAEATAPEVKHPLERKPSPPVSHVPGPVPAVISARSFHTPPQRVEFQTSRPVVSAKASAASPVPQSPPVLPEQPKETPPARIEPENVTPVPALVPSVPEPNQATLNAGMLIPVRLLDSLTSERSHAGDSFAATLDRELVANGFVVAERGARVEGRVIAADRGARTLSLELKLVHTSDNQDVAVQTERFDKQSEPDHSQAATKIGAGAAIGAVVGAIAGGGKGAAIGAGAGGGIGAGDVLLTRKAAALPSETRLTFRLRAPVTITERVGQ
jgi:hypothetical protein